MSALLSFYRAITSFATGIVGLVFTGLLSIPAYKTFKDHGYSFKGYWVWHVKDQLTIVSFLFSIFIIIIFSCVEVISMQYAEVPNVVGIPYSQARQTLQESGFACNDVDDIYLYFTVTEQLPDAVNIEYALKGSIITLTLEGMLKDDSPKYPIYKLDIDLIPVTEVMLIKTGYAGDIPLYNRYTQITSYMSKYVMHNEGDYAESVLLNMRDYLLFYRGDKPINKRYIAVPVLGLFYADPEYDYKNETYTCYDRPYVLKISDIKRAIDIEIENLGLDLKCEVVSRKQLVYKDRFGKSHTTTFGTDNWEYDYADLELRTYSQIFINAETFNRDETPKELVNKLRDMQPLAEVEKQYKDK